MSPNRPREYILPALIIVAGIAAVTMVLLLATNWLFPELSSQSGLSFNEIGHSLGDQVTTVTNLTGLSIGTDLILFIAAYILVCVLLWLQAEIRAYFANRSHF